jgi:peptidyl-prolyl cis-trans isomerase C
MRFFAHILAVAVATHTLLAAAPLFDHVVAKGKNLEVKASEVEENFISYKANRLATGERTPNSPEEIKAAEKEILNHLIATKLLGARATEADRTNAVAFADKFIAEKKSRALSEAAFNRQIRATGLSPEEFQKQVLEQATVRQVVDRELRGKQTVTDTEIEKFYKENQKLFQEPERWKVQHIHLGFRDRLTLNELPKEALEGRKVKMDELLKRARAGEDFAKLVKENSEDSLSRDEGGEYTFSKGQMPPEFEAAAMSLKPGQISDVVTTRYGWHIIKFIEGVPAKTQDLAAAKEKIKDSLLQQATQKALPDFIKKLREEAAVEIVDPSLK